MNGNDGGAQLTYDAERRLSHWQSSPSNPTSSADYLYDGSGQRMEQVETNNGTSTKVYYLFGGAEEVSTAGSTSTLTKYYSAGGLLIGENIGGTISYLASDGLGSVSEALSTSGTVTAAQLYGPYGGVRYLSGSMPTAKGFTGQRADAATGLDYYGARYYDPALGQFTTADTKQGPNRFGYVAGNPETLTDPTGQRRDCSQGDCGNPPPPPGGGGGGGSGGGSGSGGGGCTRDCGDNPPSGCALHGGCQPVPQSNCRTLSSCETQKDAAVSALEAQRNKDLGFGALLLIITDILRAKLDDGNLVKELMDDINLAVALSQTLPLVINAIFGASSAIGQIFQGLATAANFAIGGLRAIQSLTNAWGFAQWGWGLLSTGFKVVEGGLGTIVDEGINLLGSAVVNGAASWAYVLLQRGQDEAAEADEWSAESTHDWCSTNPGACGTVANWNV